MDELCLTLSPMLAGPGPGRIVAGPEHPAVRLALAGLLEEDGALFTRYARHPPGRMTPMDLPVMPPVAPMLAKSVKDVPDGPGFLYEPKWDGFRCIVFRDGDEVELGSRNERPMTRYFPEVVAAVKEQLPERCVVDAEIVIAAGDKLDFEALLQRIHPAKSRVDLLAEQTPASLVVFDLLALGDESYLDTPLGERRKKLDQVLGAA